MVVMGIEDGLLIGFIGGLLIDMLVPGRPLGATTLALLLTLGIAFLVARTVGLGPGRKAMASALSSS